MHEIAPGIFHWVTFHEGIQAKVSSYFVRYPGGGTLIDPRVPAEGIEWFRLRGPPRHALLTNRLHYRHCGRFVRAYGVDVRCHVTGINHFKRGEPVLPFEHGDLLPEGIRAHGIGVLCPEETAFHVTRASAVALGDCAIRSPGARSLSFVPDELLGADPAAVKLGLRARLESLLALDFDHLLLAHGNPFVGEGRSALQRFLGFELRRAA
jgi:hypothetical protein